MRRWAFPGAGPDALGQPRLAVPLAFLAGTLLSLCMEFLQIYLPRRVPSIWIWCSMPAYLDRCPAGCAAGEAGGTVALECISQPVAGRGRCGVLVLLALWPFALLFPAAVPFGLGQVLERIDDTLQDWLLNTLFEDWLPLGDFALTPLSLVTEML
jgi:hypothetical protein